MGEKESEASMKASGDAGYLHPKYAASLSEFGVPRYLTRSGGWLLERKISGTNFRDAMGCYPIFACRNWAQLSDDLNELKNDFVSLTVVTDPTGDYTSDTLNACFPDRVLPFKEHFIVNFNCPQTVSKHHRYYAKRALAVVQVELVRDAKAFLAEWLELYGELTKRLHLNGIKAFSRSSLTQQLDVPGVVMLRGVHSGEVVGAHIWYVQDGIAYSHLAAVNGRGYELMASYALYAYALEYFAGKVRLLDLGGGAGIDSRQNDGLTKFKRGWANQTQVAFLCGRIFDHETYNKIVELRGAGVENYFPAYREGEFI